MVAVLFPLAAMVLIAFGITNAASVASDLTSRGIAKPICGTIGLAVWLAVFTRPAIAVLTTRGYAIAFEGDRIRFFGKTIAASDFSVMHVVVGAMGLGARITLVLKNGEHRTVRAAYIEGMNLRPQAQS
jgi:hypothetical protein